MWAARLRHDGGAALARLTTKDKKRAKEEERRQKEEAKKKAMKKTIQVSNEDVAIKEKEEAKKMEMKKTTQYKIKSHDEDDLNEFLCIADEIDKLSKDESMSEEDTMTSK